MGESTDQRSLAHSSMPLRTGKILHETANETGPPRTQNINERELKSMAEKTKTDIISGEKRITLRHKDDTV